VRSLLPGKTGYLIATGGFFIDGTNDGQLRIKFNHFSTILKFLHKNGVAPEE
jgi:hypothetical protein